MIKAFEFQFSWKYLTTFFVWCSQRNILNKIVWNIGFFRKCSHIFSSISTKDVCCEQHLWSKTLIFCLKLKSGGLGTVSFNFTKWTIMWCSRFNIMTSYQICNNIAIWSMSCLNNLPSYSDIWSWWICEVHCGKCYYQM